MGEWCDSCWDCLDDPSKGLANPTNARMILCPTCGNKRCPRASDHRLDCTGSNAPGQAGSRYGGGLPSPPPSPDPAALWALVQRWEDRAETAESGLVVEAIAGCCDELAALLPPEGT